MDNEANVGELMSLADSLGLTASQRLLLAIAVGQLMWESWREGYEYGWRLGWYSGADDIAFRDASNVVTSH